jgi:hypothetical protein
LGHSARDSRRSRQGNVFFWTEWQSKRCEIKKTRNRPLETFVEPSGEFLSGGIPLRRIALRRIG